MTGWRLGYMGAPAWVAEACAKIQGQFTSGANAFGQKAAAYALMADMSPTNKMREAFLKRKELVKAKLSEIPGIKTNDPQGAFYIFPDISAYFGKSFNGQTISNSDDLALYLLEHAHVATVSGSAFGADECLRLSFAASEEELLEAVRRIGEALGKLG
jgi:aspartate aminotransferase